MTRIISSVMPINSPESYSIYLKDSSGTSLIGMELVLFPPESVHYY
jgi:hypothetical protein